MLPMPGPLEPCRSTSFSSAVIAHMRAAARTAGGFVGSSHGRGSTSVAPPLAAPVTRDAALACNVLAVPVQAATNNQANNNAAIVGNGGRVLRRCDTRRGGRFSWLHLQARLEAEQVELGGGGRGARGLHARLAASARLIRLNDMIVIWSRRKSLIHTNRLLRRDCSDTRQATDRRSRLLSAANGSHRLVEDARVSCIRTSTSLSGSSSGRSSRWFPLRSLDAASSSASAIESGN